MKVHCLPALSDNYIFCLENEGQALVVDPGEAEPVLDWLKTHGLKLGGILVTHHHPDHIDGVNPLLEQFKVPVWIPARDQSRLPFQGTPLHEGDQISSIGFDFEIWELPGHTLNHIAYIEKNINSIFSGDVIFGFGCGRLFEGSFLQGFESLKRFETLPPDFKIYCTHEYTTANLNFLESLSTPPNQSPIESLKKATQHRLKTEGKTVPLSLKEQLEWNPFLKSKNLEEFTKLRTQRNNF